MLLIAAHVRETAQAQRNGAGEPLKLDTSTWEHCISFLEGHYLHCSLINIEIRNIYATTYYWETNTVTANACATLAFAEHACNFGLLKRPGLLPIAAATAPLDVVNYLAERMGETLRHAFDIYQATAAAAAAHGRIEVLEWVLARTPYALMGAAPAAAAAAAHGHVDTLLWFFCKDNLPQHYGFKGIVPHKCMASAAGGGHLPVMDWIQSEYYDGWQGRMQWHAQYATCASAAQSGQLKMEGCIATYLPQEFCCLLHLSQALQWLREHYYAWTEDTVTGAARNNRTKVLRWALEHDAPVDMTDACHAAAEQNALAALKILYAHNAADFPRGTAIVEAAAGSWDIDALQWLLDTVKCPWDAAACYRSAAVSGSYSALDFLHERRVVFPPDICEVAWRSGRRWVCGGYKLHDGGRGLCDVAAWCNKVSAPPQQSSFTSSGCCACVRSWRYVCIEHMNVPTPRKKKHCTGNLDEQQALDVTTKTPAAQTRMVTRHVRLYRRHALCLISLQAARASTVNSIVTVVRACSAPQGRALEWLVDNVTPAVDDGPMAKAAARGHGAAVRALMYKCSPWDERAALTAAREGQLDVLEFLHSCLPQGEHDAAICAEAATAGRLDVLQWARREGLAWDERTCREAHVNGHMDVLRYAVDEGCACSDAAMRDLLQCEEALEQRRQVRQRRRDEAQQRKEEEARLKQKERNRRLARARALCKCNGWLCRRQCRLINMEIRSIYLRIHDEETHTMSGNVCASLEFVRHAYKFGLLECTRLLPTAAAVAPLDVINFLARCLAGNLRCNHEIYCRMAAKAAARGRMEVLQWIHARRPYPRKSYVPVAAAEHGHLDILEWFVLEEPIYQREVGAGMVPSECMVGAAGGGHIHVMQWIHSKYTRNGTRMLEAESYRVCEKAAQCGQLKALVWLRTQRIGDTPRYSWDESVVTAAARFGRWLYQQGCPVSKQLEHDIVRSGDQDILARLLERGHKFHDGGRHACDVAVAYDQAHIIDWLKDARIYRPNKKTMAAAVAVGAVQAVQSLVYKGCPWDNPVILTAAFEGHLDILQFLYSCLPHGRRQATRQCPVHDSFCLGASGCRLCDGTCREHDADIRAQAAAAGRLAVLQWARREGLAWDERVCREAHSNGHMDVLQYALGEGCACNDSAMRVLERHEDVMEWRQQELQRAREEAERREEEAHQKELAQLRASCSCETYFCYVRYLPVQPVTAALPGVAARARAALRRSERTVPSTVRQMQVLNLELIQGGITALGAEEIAGTGHRMRKWVQPGLLPKRFVASLVREQRRSDTQADCAMKTLETYFEKVEPAAKPKRRRKKTAKRATGPLQLEPATWEHCVSFLEGHYLHCGLINTELRSIYLDLFSWDTYTFTENACATVAFAAHACNFGLLKRKALMHAAAAVAPVEVLDYLEKRLNDEAYISWISSKMAAAAAACGRVDWLYAKADLLYSSSARKGLGECLAAAAGGPSLMEWVRDDALREACVKLERGEEHAACALAAAFNQLEALQWLRKVDLFVPRYQWNSDTVTAAARTGSLSRAAHSNAADPPACLVPTAPCTLSTAALKWALENDAPVNMAAASYGAAEYGQVEALKLLRTHDADKFPKDKRLATLASKCGCVETLQWLLDTARCAWDADACCRAAAANWNTGLLQWLKARGVTFPADMCEVAWTNGRNWLFWWLYDEGCPVSRWLELRMVRDGAVGTIQTLNEKGHAFHDGGDTFCEVAAANNQAHMINYLVKAQNFKLDGRAMSAAAQGGHAAAARALVYNSCPWDARDALTASRCAGAAALMPADGRARRGHMRAGGRLDVLQWAQLLTGEITMCVLFFILKPVDRHDDNVLYSSASSLTAAHREHDAAICAHAAAAGRLDVLQWARREGLAWDERTCREALVNGHMDVLQYALDEGGACSDSVQRGLELHHEAAARQKEELTKLAEQERQRKEAARRERIAEKRAACACSDYSCRWRCQWDRA
ncbi:hypothetical protein JKP88DRAFT_249768 [Tribonema minus]|uniref:Uncharacterized protein n=1 Tax=Tribonema minus TaxID=303371 RepID=A0A835YK49_9STRA|nr:hypothetical protein JKP88DRAFT_249768 [Tribonema minus]